MPNCSEDVSTLAFISELQVFHLLYKHLLKHDITRMSEILSQTQPYIQLEEVMKSSANQTLKCGKNDEQSKSRETSTNASHSNQGHPGYKRQALLVLSLNPCKTFKREKHFTPLRLPIDEVFNVIKDQSWVRRPKSIQYDLALPITKEYYSYHYSKAHQTIHCRNLRKYLKELVCQDFLKESVLTPG